ncbi:hypothetical protein PF010_g27783 [Phytophthora fragariae]|uniref:Serine aminopeptidase S33 domain-containing protein n=1 Tax=Phytophthora fragariae TaxID=53985 RepID=A0A6G0JTG0_9STRA|nr:hypothetical protein PF010_g27783 [Phytophthora fragariae]
MATRARVNSALRAHHMPAHLRHLEGKFKNARGQSLSYLALFPPSSTPLRAVVLYLHGIGDHSRRYFHLYERLCNAGFGVLAYDLLSHGASDSDQHGLRAHSARFQYFVDDTNEFLKMAKTQLYPQLALPQGREPKLVLSGMSYGTLVSLHTILSGVHGFSGVVLVAPALLVEMTTTLRVQAVFARPLSKLIPKARIVPGVNGDFLCRDQDYVNDFKADPLTVSEPVTARMGAETLKAMRALEADKRVEDKDSALCKLPMLMMMGSNDKVTSLELAQVFYERLAAQDKEFKVFDDYFHALFDDPESEAVFVHLENWLKKRFPNPEGGEKVDKIEEGDETKAETAEEATKEEKEVEEVVMEEVTDETVAKEETKVEVSAKEETAVAEGVEVEAAVTEEVNVDAAVTEEVTKEEKEGEAVVVEEAKVEGVTKEEKKDEAVVVGEATVELTEEVTEEEKKDEAVVVEKATVEATKEVTEEKKDEAVVVEEAKVEAIEEVTKEEKKVEAVVVDEATVEATKEAIKEEKIEDTKVEDVFTDKATQEEDVEAAGGEEKVETDVTEEPKLEVVATEEAEIDTSVTEETETAVNEETEVEAGATQEVKAEAVVTEAETVVTEENEVEVAVTVETKIDAVAAEETKVEVAVTEEKEVEVVTEEKEVEVVAEEKEVEVVAEIAVQQETNVDDVDASSDTTVTEDANIEAVESTASEQAKPESDAKNAKDGPAAVEVSDKTDANQVEASKSSDKSTVDDMPTSSDVSSETPKVEIVGSAKATEEKTLA